MIDSLERALDHAAVVPPIPEWLPDCQPGTMLRVNWVDARYLSGWHDREEIVQWERDFNVYWSCGFFVMLTAYNLLLADTWTPVGWEKRQVGGVNAFPLSAVRSCALLEERR